MRSVLADQKGGQERNELAKAGGEGRPTGSGDEVRKPKMPPPPPPP